MALPDTSAPNEPEADAMVPWFSRANRRLRGLGVMNTEVNVCMLRGLGLDFCY